MFSRVLEVHFLLNQQASCWWWVGNKHTCAWTKWGRLRSINSGHLKIHFGFFFHPYEFYICNIFSFSLSPIVAVVGSTWKFIINLKFQGEFVSKSSTSLPSEGQILVSFLMKHCHGNWKICTNPLILFWHFYSFNHLLCFFPWLPHWSFILLFFISICLTLSVLVVNGAIPWAAYMLFQAPIRFSNQLSKLIHFSNYD